MGNKEATCFYLECYQYTLRIMRRIGYCASGEKAANKLIKDAWEAHLSNGKTFPETLMAGLNKAQMNCGRTVEMN